MTVPSRSLVHTDTMSILRGITRRRQMFDMFKYTFLDILVVQNNHNNKTNYNNSFAII